MKKSVLILLSIFLSISVFAQDRFATVDRDFVFSSMPETAKMMEMLEQRQAQFLNELKVKQDYLAQKKMEYMSAVEGDRLDTDQLYEELLRLEKSIEEFVRKAEEALNELQIQLTTPIQEKLMATIAAIAKSRGYTHVFNQTSDGSSEVLFAPEADNLTIPVLKELGIAVAYPPK